MSTDTVADAAVVTQVGRWCLHRGIRSIQSLQPATRRTLEARAEVRPLSQQEWTLTEQWLQARTPLHPAPACLRCVIAGAGECAICRRPMRCPTCHEPMDPFLTSLGEHTHLGC